jgi:hypothetical protein
MKTRKLTPRKVASLYDLPVRTRDYVPDEKSQIVIGPRIKHSFKVHKKKSEFAGMPGPVYLNFRKKLDRKIDPLVRWAIRRGTEKQLLSLYGNGGENSYTVSVPSQGSSKFR